MIDLTWHGFDTIGEANTPRVTGLFTMDPRFLESAGCSGDLVEAIESEEWNKVQRLCKVHPERACEWHLVKDFFDDQDSLVLPLHQAVAACNPSIKAIRSLIEACPAAILSQESTFQRIPLHIAALNPKITHEIMKLLLDYAPETTTECDAFERLALHYACSGHIIDASLVEVLVDAFPDSVSIRNGNGWLPIHAACRSGASFQIIRLLLDAYPESIVAETSKGNTTLDMLLCQTLLGRESSVLGDARLGRHHGNKASVNLGAKTATA